MTSPSKETAKLTTIFRKLRHGHHLLPSDSLPPPDRRHEGSLLALQGQRHAVLSFESLTSSCDFLVPIIVNLYLFDAELRARTSEILTFVAPSTEIPALPFTLDIPTSPSAAFALTPGYLLDPASDRGFDGIHVVAVFDHPYLGKLASALLDYYTKPAGDAQERVKRQLLKSLQGLTGVTPLRATFAFSVAKLTESHVGGRLQFSEVVAADQVNGDVLTQHIRKTALNERLLPFELALAVAPCDRECAVARRLSYFWTDARFSVEWQNEVILRITSVSLGGKYGVRNKQLGVTVSCKCGEEALDVFDGKPEFRTRCPWNGADEDIVLRLPPLAKKAARAAQVEFMVCALPPALSSADLGRAVTVFQLPLWTNNAIPRPGIHKLATDDAKTFLTVFAIPQSSAYSASGVVNKLVAHEYKYVTDVEYPELVVMLPVVLDGVLSSSSISREAGFETLLQICRLFPFDKSDERYSGQLKPSQQRKRTPSGFALDAVRAEAIPPVEHLLFYAKYCAWRLPDSNIQYAHFLNGWLGYMTQPVGIARLDLRAIPFLAALLLKGLVCATDARIDVGFQRVVKRLASCAATLQGMEKVAGPARELAARVNLYLSGLVADVVLLRPRAVVEPLIAARLKAFNVRDCEGDRAPLGDFLRMLFTPENLEALAVSSGQSPFPRIFQKILESFGDFEQISQTAETVLRCLRYLSGETFTKVVNTLRPFADILGENTELVLKCANPELLVSPFILCLIILINVQPADVNLRTLSSAVPILQISSKMDGEVWSRFSFTVQVIIIRAIERVDLGILLNLFIVPAFRMKFAPPLAPLLVDATAKFIRAHLEFTLRDPKAETARLVKAIVVNLNESNVTVLNTLAEVEKQECRTHGRVRAFFLRGIRKHPSFDDSQLRLLASPFFALGEAFLRITTRLKQLDHQAEACHEFVADCMLELADLYRASPTCRVKTLLELAQFHLSFHFFTEATVSQLTAAASIADYLALLGRLPRGVFADAVHPANAFTDACPNARAEVVPKKARRYAGLSGYCAASIFSEFTLIQLLQQAMSTCKRAALWELSTKLHALLRPLAEERHLWSVLQMQYVNGAVAWGAILAMGSKGDRALGNYYRVQFQDEGYFIYRETQFANLWEEMEKLSARGAVLANGRQVVIVNQGEELDPTTFQPDRYHVHVKAVQPYFSAEERRARMTAFEQNHNVDRFYFDLPFSKSAQMSIEHCWLKRIILVPKHAIPYLNSRVRIPPENIQKLEYSPIEYCCQSLQLQVDRIQDAVNREDWTTLQPLLQGSLMTQVNEGPMKMAEVFLAGASESDHTKNLRQIFRVFLEANTEALKKHETRFVSANPVYLQLQEVLELGLSRLGTALQPFLK